MIGARIKEQRQQLGYSQEYLAELLGYKTKSSIQKIESGKNDIPQSKVTEFARALKTTEAYLLGIVEKPAPKDELAPPASSRDALRQIFIREGILPEGRDLTDEEFNLLIGAAKGLLQPGNE